MRKLAPAFVLTTIIAVASAPAFAMGDKRKAENANGATTSQPASTYSAPSTPASKPANGAGIAAAQSDAKTAAVGANDPTRCDPSKYASRDLMPKGCGAGAGGDGTGGSTTGTGTSGSAASSASSSGAGSSGGDSK